MQNGFYMDGEGTMSMKCPCKVLHLPWSWSRVKVLLLKVQCKFCLYLFDLYMPCCLNIGTSVSNCIHSNPLVVWMACVLLYVTEPQREIAFPTINECGSMQACKAVLPKGTTKIIVFMLSPILVFLEQHRIIVSQVILLPHTFSCHCFGCSEWYYNGIFR